MHWFKWLYNYTSYRFLRPIRASKSQTFIYGQFLPCLPCDLCSARPSDLICDPHIRTRLRTARIQGSEPGYASRVVGGLGGGTALRHPSYQDRDRVIVPRGNPANRSILGGKTLGISHPTAASEISSSSGSKGVIGGQACHVDVACHQQGTRMMAKGREKA